jgi:hypothetical protein
MAKFFTPSTGGVSTTAPQTTNTSNGFADQGDVIQKAALMDMLTTGGKNVAKITSLGQLLNPTPTATQQKTIDAQTKKDEVKATAQSLQTLIANKANYDPKVYEDTKNSIASDLYVKMKEAANMGAALSASEIGIMAGQAPAIQQIGPSAGSRINQFFTGKVPVQRGQLNESDQTLQNKLNIIINGQNAAPLSQIGQSQTTQQSQVGGQETLNPNIAQNAGRNLQDILTGLPSLGMAAVNMTPLGGLVDMMQGKQPDMLKPMKTVISVGAGIINNLGETVGVTKDENGNVTWSPKAAFIHDYNHPIDTALWLLPALKMFKGAKAIEGAGGATTVEKGAGIFEQASKDASKMDLAKVGKAARGVATIVPESVVKSEEIMGKALQYTKSNNLEGMAKELETSIPEQGKIIDNWAVAKDTQIGPQAAGEIVDQVISKVEQSTAAKANPDLVNAFKADLTKQLEKGELPGGMAKGEVAGTDFSTINKTRKYFISGKDTWFNNGQPVGSPTNDLNAIEFMGSNALKDIMSQADTEGVVKSALDRQHTAYQTYPVLSKIVSRKGPGFSAISMKWSLIRKAWEATGGKIVESAQIQNARSLQGEVVNPESGLQSLLQGQTPQTQVVNPLLPNVQQPLPQVPSARPFPLPNEIINNVLKGKGPAQSTRLVRDMRYNQGNPQFRGLQDILLNQASKAKYK